MEGSIFLPPCRPPATSRYVGPEYPRWTASKGTLFHNPYMETDFTPDMASLTSPPATERQDELDEILKE
jgi:hypothetical protein